MTLVLKTAVLATGVVFCLGVAAQGDEGSRTLLIYSDTSDRAAARAMLGNYVDGRIALAERQRQAELAALRSPAAWRRRQEQTRARLEQFFGKFGPKCPLNAQIVGKLQRPDYTIEKLIFESQPRYYCTANVYIPKSRTFPLPGVLFTCGHAADGKAARLYHECCLGLVLKGYIVLALDPTGQGERSEYFDHETGESSVPLCVSQHHYLGRPSWLVGRSLAGYRTWDCTRALDYLLTRPEVDREKIAAVGNSGGGIMALLITAVDPRVKVCAAAHPGGSMEATYLTGRALTRADILGLIAPRPCLFVVGDTSGEEATHRAKMLDMLRYYKGLGASQERCQMELVDGEHDMKQSKREPCYGWLNHWFAKEKEGSSEPPLGPETVEALRCTKTGFVIRDLTGESGQRLNAKLADKLRPRRAVPPDPSLLESQREKLRATIARRIGLKLAAARPAPECTACGVSDGDGFSAEKLLLRSEDQIVLPSLLLKPVKPLSDGPVVVLVAELGKPSRSDLPSLAIELTQAGYTVLAVDVRGTGETDPRDRVKLGPVARYDAQQFRFDTYAVRAARFGTTMLAMRTFDVIRAIDYAESRNDLSGRPVVLVGQGLGGTWALAAASFDSRPSGVVCVGTLPSYKLLVQSQYYAVRDYYWINGALKDFDLPDVVGLAAPRPVTLIDPVDAMLDRIDPQRCRQVFQSAQDVYAMLGAADKLRYVHTDMLVPKQTARHVHSAIRAMSVR